MRLSDFRLAAFDMDSTLIEMECIDELAAKAGRLAECAVITEAAMRGDLDFGQSLRARLALVEGLPEAALHEIATTRMRLMPGAEPLMAALREAGIRTLLVSGGFTFFAGQVQQMLGMDWMRANVLEIADGRLTGRVLGEIVDAAGKRETLLQQCQAMRIEPAQAIAVGDGANDIPMLEAAGLGVAFHAKPRAREAADLCIDVGGLDRLLEMLA